MAVYIGYTQLIPQGSVSSASAGVQVEKVGTIASEMDAGGLAALSDSAKVIDYNSPTDLTGLGNAAPFGP